MIEPRRTGRPAGVAITGLAVASAHGRGTAPLLAAVSSGKPAFVPVARFDVSKRRAGFAAELAGARRLTVELADVVDEACAGAQLTSADREACALLFAGRPDPVAAARAAGGASAAGTQGGVADSDPARLVGNPAVAAAAVAERCGLRAGVRAYTSACVSASMAVADAASAVTAGRATRVVVAAGFLVNSDDFASFDAGRVLADDGAVRPFSTGRRGLLLGDAVVAVVLESAATVRSRQVTALAWITGWGSTGDAYHVCQPHPGGHGLARAITRALRLAGLTPADIGYLNANGTGTPQSDAAEAAALHSALGPDAARIPVSSTKSVHGHALEASGLLELVVTTLALRAGRLPVNAGFVGPDHACELDLVLAGTSAPRTPYALTVNSAFGGANTALVVRAA